MRRMLPIAGLVLLALTAFPQQAEADLWDWLQEWSGPGPFHLRVKPVGNGIFNVCRKNTGDRGVFVSDFDGTQDVTCFFGDVRTFTNDQPDNFGDIKVDVTIFEAGVAARVHRSTEIGFGAGALRFSSQGQTHTKLVLTAPRIVIRPALLYRDEVWWEGRPAVAKILASIVKLYMKANIIVGRMQGSDFGLVAGQPNFDFDVDNERVFSTGFILDFTELAWQIKNALE